MLLNTENKINLTLTSLSKNTSIGSLKLGQDPNSVYKSLKFLEKAHYLENNHIYRNTYLEDTFGSQETDDFVSNFGRELFNYSTMNFDSLSSHGFYLNNHLIRAPFRLYSHFIETSGTSFSEIIESFIPYNDDDIVIGEVDIDMQHPNYFINRDIEDDVDVGFFKDHEINVLDDDEFMPDVENLFFDQFDFPLSLSEMNDILYGLNDINNICINLNFLQYHNTICLIYDNIRLLKIGNDIFPFFTNHFKIDDICQGLTNLNALQTQTKLFLEFNQTFKINTLNILMDHKLPSNLAMEILEFTYDIQLLVDLGLITI